MSTDLERIKIGLTSDFRPVYWKERYTHLLVLGKSGTGKSSFISHCWESDELWKHAKVLVEPSGFLTQDCYSISKGRARYCSLDSPVSLNPMFLPYPPDTVSDIVAECINQVIRICTPNERLTAKMRVILDEELKDCLEHNRKSLLYVRDRLERRTGDTETRSGILARLNFLLSDKRMEPLICGRDSVRWGEVIQKRESFILDCFGMSAEKMIFTGNVISQGIKNYFRYERPSVYRPMSLYIDECHNFASTSFLQEILREARKFKISCVLSTQHFAGMDDTMVRTLLNVGSIVAFRLGAREAHMVAREMDISPEELQFLEKYHLAYLTAGAKGLAKAPRPPLVRKIAPMKVEPPRKAQRGWFPLEPYSAT